jgi:HK97 family phage prohead protease
MPEPKLLGSEEFRQAALDAKTSDEKPLVEVRLRGSFDTEVKAADDGSRKLSFTISTASVDRMGDTIAVDGWKLASYKKNPVVLWAHDASMLPVAKANKVYVDGGKLKADTEFTPPGMAKFNDTVFDMYKGGFLSATSVGFSPLKYAFTDDPQRRYGIDFLEQELLEFSAVPVPANGEALIEGRAAGIDLGPILDWAELAMKGLADPARIVRLADDVLTRSPRDAALLSWGERILAANGKSIVDPERVRAIERAATAQRLAAARRNRDLELIQIQGR